MTAAFREFIVLEIESGGERWRRLGQRYEDTVPLGSGDQGRLCLRVII